MLLKRGEGARIPVSTVRGKNCKRKPADLIVIFNQMEKFDHRGSFNCGALGVLGIILRHYRLAECVIHL